MSKFSQKKMQIDSGGGIYTQYYKKERIKDEQLIKHVYIRFPIQTETTNMNSKPKEKRKIINFFLKNFGFYFCLPKCQSPSRSFQSQRCAIFYVVFYAPVFAKLNIKKLVMTGLVLSNKTLFEFELVRKLCNLISFGLSLVQKERQIKMLFRENYVILESIPFLSSTTVVPNHLHLQSHSSIVLTFWSHQCI